MGINKQGGQRMNDFVLHNGWRIVFYGVMSLLPFAFSFYSKWKNGTHFPAIALVFPGLGLITTIGVIIYG